MSIALAVPATVRPFAGFDELWYPIGTWLAVLSVLGDASGGLMTVNIRMQNAGANAAALYWSLEQLMVNSTVAGPRSVRLQIVNMDPFPIQPSTGALNDNYHVLLDDAGGTSAAENMRLQDSQAGLPLFLGRPQPDGNNAGLAVDDANVTGTSLGVRAQGYVWSARSIVAPGGLRRPIDGLYSQG